jgi:hypothetical protein
MVRDPITEGVQEQVAMPLVAVTLSQPVMVFVPSLNETRPAVLAAAEILTAFPYFAVVTVPGSDKATVGVAFVTVKVIVTGVDPVDPFASVTVTVCVYVPTVKLLGAFNWIAPVGLVDNVVIVKVEVFTSGVTYRTMTTPDPPFPP